MNTTLVDSARSLLYGAAVDKKALECRHCGFEAPRCEFYNGWCGHKADVLAWVPFTWRRPIKLTPQFACDECWQRYARAWGSQHSSTQHSSEAK